MQVCETKREDRNDGRTESRLNQRRRNETCCRLTQTIQQCHLVLQLGIAHVFMASNPASLNVLGQNWEHTGGKAHNPILGTLIIVEETLMEMYFVI